MLAGKAALVEGHTWPRACCASPSAWSPHRLPQAEAPEELRHNRTFAALQAHVQALRDRHHSVPRAAGEAPKEWVRGWSDSGKDLGSGGLASSSGGGGGSRAGGSS